LHRLRSAGNETGRAVELKGPMIVRIFAWPCCAASNIGQTRYRHLTGHHSPAPYVPVRTHPGRQTDSCEPTAVFLAV
jgi:hypothetical protein